MNLKDMSFSETRMATCHYPLLLCGSNAAGKTYALMSMSADDKKRTAVFNFDLTPIGLGTDEEYHAVYSVGLSSERMDVEIAKVQAAGVQMKNDGVDAKDPKRTKLRDKLAHLKGIRKNWFYVDDREAIDNLVTAILDCSFNDDIDRIVGDTLSDLIDFCNAWAAANFSDRQVWQEYGTALQKVMQAFKEATIVGYKFTYVYAHHDSIPPAQYTMTPKEVVAVKGGIMKGNVEKNFGTIVFTYMTEDGKRMMSCEPTNPLDTSRTKLVDTGFTFERESLDDLEQIFNHKKVVTDGVLVDVTDS